MAFCSPMLRSAILALVVAFGIISFGVGINALVKSGDQKDFVKKHAPAGVTVIINTNDIVRSGIVLAVGNGLLALTAFITFLITSPLLRPNARVAPKHLRLASYILLFFTVWVLATLIPFDVIARNRQARVSASIGGQALPAGFIQQEQQLLGVSPVYWDDHNVHLVAIIPWFTVLFGAMSGMALFRASNIAARTAASAGAGTHLVHENEPVSPVSPTNEKGDVRRSEAEEKARYEERV